MKVAVIGSRGFADRAHLYRELDNLSKHIQHFTKIDLIISGGAKGADTLAMEYAHERKIETKVFLPEYQKYGRAAPIKRNQTIVENAEIVVAFWDGKSKGTSNAITSANKLKRQVVVIRF